MFFINRKKRKEKKLNEIQKTINSYNEDLHYIEKLLDRSYKERNKSKNRLSNFYDRYMICKFYCPTKYCYDKWNRITEDTIRAEEEGLFRLNEDIFYQKERMHDIQNRIDKLCEEMKGGM